jgi:CDP-glucose 4,6-dehydratase
MQEKLNMKMNDFYRNKTVLVTGHTGFKGSWLCQWLSIMGAKVVGISNDVPTTPSNFEVSKLTDQIRDIRLDIRDLAALKNAVSQIRPDVVFHLAAQSLVRPSYEFPIETISTNALGTANLLETLRGYDREVVAVLITSDKAYDNVEWVWGYRETDALGGKDIYSASKGMAELAIKGFLESFFRNQHSNIRLGIARAGNVIGGGDWARDRIVPDCIRAWSDNQVVDIRNPSATRPWQHVLEPLSGYLALGHALSTEQRLHGEAFNLGPPSNQNYSVSTLIDEMSLHWENVHWNDISDKKNQLHEAGLLKLNCDKALALFDWKPALDFAKTVEMTVNWYKEYYQSSPDSMGGLCRRQILEYCSLAAGQGIDWAYD